MKLAELKPEQVSEVAVLMVTQHLLSLQAMLGKSMAVAAMVADMDAERVASLFSTLTAYAQGKATPTMRVEIERMIRDGAVMLYGLAAVGCGPLAFEALLAANAERSPPAMVLACALARQRIERGDTVLWVLIVHLMSQDPYPGPPGHHDARATAAVARHMLDLNDEVDALMRLTQAAQA